VAQIGALTSVTAVSGANLVITAKGVSTSSQLAEPSRQTALKKNVRQRSPSRHQALQSAEPLIAVFP
jgi:hypothetical protein